MAYCPSYAQLEALLEFLEENPGISKCLLRTTQAWQETKRKWVNLATSLNALGGAYKDGQGRAKYWTEKKCALKRQCSQIAISMRQTGGSLSRHLPILSNLDNRLVAMMGGQEFAIGNPMLQVNPCPDMSVPAVSPTVDSVPVLAELLDQMDTFSIPSTSHYQATPIMPPSAPLSSVPLQTTPSSEPLPATPFSVQPPAAAPHQDITPRRRRRRSSISRDQIIQKWSGLR